MRGPARPVRFLNQHLRSQKLASGIVHMFSPTHEKLRNPNGALIEHRGWAAFCAMSLTHNDLPGETMDVATTPITCVACLGTP